MVVKDGVSAIPLIPKLTHFSIGSFAVPWVWNSTSTAMIYGECGQVPFSIWSHVNVLTYHARL